MKNVLLVGDSSKKCAKLLYSNETSRECDIPSVFCIADESNENDNVYVLLPPDNVYFHKPLLDPYLRVSDGSIIIIDCLEGFTFENEIQIRRMRDALITPTLILDNFEKLLLNNRNNLEEVFFTFKDLIYTSNRVFHYLDDFPNPYFKNYEFNPLVNNVAFSLSDRNFGFTLESIANYYSTIYKCKPESILKNIWGNHYVDISSGKTSKKPKDGFIRGFIGFILLPLLRILDNFDDIELIASDMHIDIDFTNTDIHFQNLLLFKWLPLRECLLDLLKLVPLKSKTRKYRSSILVSKTRKSKFTSYCINEPLIISVITEKRVNVEDSSVYHYYAHVHNGILTIDDNFILFSQSSDSSEMENTKHKCNISKIVSIRTLEEYSTVECEDIVIIEINYKIKQWEKENITIIQQETYESNPFLPFRPPILHSYRLLKATLQVPSYKESIHINVALDEIGTDYLLVDCNSNYTLLTMFSEDSIYIELLLKEIRKKLNEKCEYTIHDTRVQYFETSTKKTPLLMAKSSCRQNSIIMCCQPMDNNIIEEESNYTPSYIEKNNPNQMYLFTDESDNPEVSKFQNAIDNGIIGATSEGPLIQGEIIGLHFKLKGIILSSFDVHNYQITITTRKAIYGTILYYPRLAESMMRIIINSELNDLGDIYKNIYMRRGMVYEQEETKTLVKVYIHIPLDELDEFEKSINRINTGNIRIQSKFFSHWSILPGDPLEEGTKANNLMEKIREELKITDTIPNWKNLCEEQNLIKAI